MLGSVELHIHSVYNQDLSAACVPVKWLVDCLIMIKWARIGTSYNNAMDVSQECTIDKLVLTPSTQENLSIAYPCDDIFGLAMDQFRQTKLDESTIEATQVLWNSLSLCLAFPERGRGSARLLRAM